MLISDMQFIAENNYCREKPKKLGFCFFTANNTYFYRSTWIVAVRDDGSLALNAGHWFTFTTKKHINTVLRMLKSRWYVYQKNWSWFVTDGTETLPFSNAMILPK